MGEASLPQQATLVAGVAGAAFVGADAQQQGLRVLEQRGRGFHQHATPVEVADPDHACRSEHATELAQRREGIAQVGQHGVGKDGIEGAGGEGQFVGAALHKAHVADPFVGGPRAGRVELALLHVEAHDLAGQDDPGQPHGDGAGATATVEHAHAGPQVRQQDVRGLLHRPSPHAPLLDRVISQRIRLLPLPCRITHCLSIPYCPSAIDKKRAGSLSIGALCGSGDS